MTQSLMRRMKFSKGKLLIFRTKINLRSLNFGFIERRLMEIRILISKVMILMENMKIFEVFAVNNH